MYIIRGKWGYRIGIPLVIIFFSAFFYLMVFRPELTMKNTFPNIVYNENQGDVIETILPTENIGGSHCLAVFHDQSTDTYIVASSFLLADHYQYVPRDKTMNVQTIAVDGLNRQVQITTNTDAVTVNVSTS